VQAPLNVLTNAAKYTQAQAGFLQVPATATKLAGSVRHWNWASILGMYHLVEARASNNSPIGYFPLCTATHISCNLRSVKSALHGKVPEDLGANCAPLRYRQA
jgi:hypothetical protein